MNEFVENALIEEKAKALRISGMHEDIFNSFLRGESISDLAEKHGVDCLAIEDIVRFASLKEKILNENS